MVLFEYLVTGFTTFVPLQVGDSFFYILIFIFIYHDDDDNNGYD